MPEEINSPKPIEDKFLIQARSNRHTLSAIELDRAAVAANNLLADERFTNLVQGWQARVAQTPEPIQPLLHGANLGALALTIGLNTDPSDAQLIFEKVVGILSTDPTTSFQQVLDMIKEAKNKYSR